MNTEKGTKINRLLSNQPSGIVFLSSWLISQGYSLELQRHYRKSNWLTSIGRGALARSGEPIGYEGAIYAIQTQSNSWIHPGGRTALSLLGKAHYLEIAASRVILFGGKDEKLPFWFRNYDWNVNVEYFPTSFLPAEIGLTEIELKSFSIKVSDAARALMECLYLAPQKLELLECYELMESLNNLLPKQVQLLLEQSTSIKVNRLFLYMAEKAGHDWLKFIDHSRVNMGKGKRSLVKNGSYIEKYQLTVPKELENYGKESL